MPLTLSQKDEVALYLQENIKTLRLFQELGKDFSYLQKEFQGWNEAFDTFVILGTGGSSLGAQTVNSLRKDSPLIFFDNIDQHTLHGFLKTFNPEKTGFVVISKSGTTAETLALSILFTQHYQQLNIPIKNHFVFVIQDRKNSLASISDFYDAPYLCHPPIGGRYSVFSIVGVLPCLLAKIPVHEFIMGAKETIDAFLKSPESLMSKIEWIHDLHSCGIDQLVMMPYCDRLAPFSLWFRQLWAESLGKHGKGSTPIQASGTVDQHSQLQLYLDGPKNKGFIFISIQEPSVLPKMERITTPSDLELDWLWEKSLQDLFLAEYRATVETLKAANRPLLEIKLDQLDYTRLGQLMMEWILITLGTSALLKVDPFDQPAVEHGKILTKLYMQK